MKLNQNSISAQLYRWFYGTQQMPSNLCPYFWKLVTAIVFAIPLFIITIPHILMYRKGEGRDSFSERLGIGLVSWFIVFMISCMLSLLGLFWNSPSQDGFWYHMIGIGIICWMFAVGIGIAQLVKYIKETIKNKNYQKENYDENGNWIPYEDRVKRSNIIVEMIKATYYKYCPKIDWN